jgi:hypothetical protein
MSIFTRPLSDSLRRKFVAVVTIFFVTALLVPAPAAAAWIRTTDETVRARGNEIRAWLLSIPELTRNGGSRERKGVRPSLAPTKAEREAKVSELELNVAAELELKSRQRLQLSAIPVDVEGNAIQGLAATWESSAKDVVFVRKNGEALAGKPGEATLFARAGTKQATIHIRVVEGTKEPFGGKKRIDSKRSAQPLVLASKTNGFAQNRMRRQKRSHSVIKLASIPGVMPFMRDPNDDPLPDNETSSLYQPNNLIGTPPGKKRPEQ